MNKTDIMLSGLMLKKKYDGYFAAISAAYGVTKLEIEILDFYDGSEACSARDIVIDRGFAKSHVSKAVDSLIKKGYLTTKQASADRRLVKLEVTEKAAEVTARAREVRKDFFDMLYTDFSEREKSEFENYMERIAANIAASVKTSLVEDKEDTTPETEN